MPWGEFAIDYDTVQRVLGGETFLRNKAGSQLAFWEGRRDEVVDSWKRDTVRLALALDLDIVVANVVPPSGFQPEKPRKIAEDVYEFSNGSIVRYSPITHDFTQVQPPSEWHPPELSDFDSKPDPPAYHESELEMIRYVVEHLGDHRFIVTGGAGEASLALLAPTLEQSLMLIADRPDLVRAAVDLNTARANQTDVLFAREGVDGYLWGLDFAHNAGPFFSPGVFRQICLPSARSRCESAHAAGLFVLKHACGNNWALLDMFVEAGYDCYQSVQASGGMDLRDLKRQYGDRLGLWGGVSVENLVSGTPAEVIADVEYAMRWGKPNGGYIFGTSHTIAVGSKYENVLAMLDRFHELRDY